MYHSLRRKTRRVRHRRRGARSETEQVCRTERVSLICGSNFLESGAHHTPKVTGGEQTRKRVPSAEGSGAAKRSALEKFPIREAGKLYRAGLHDALCIPPPPAASTRN